MQDHCTFNNQIRLPAEAIDSLRDGLRGQLATAAQELTYAGELSSGNEQPERYLEPLRSIDALRSLLEEIGWSGPPSDLWVDLPLHGRALTLALEDQISGHTELLRDSRRDDDRREAVAGEMNSLVALALVILMKTSAHLSRPGKRKACCSSETRAGHL